MAVDLGRYLESRRAEEAGFFSVKSLVQAAAQPVVAVPAALVLIAVAFLAVWYFNRQAKIRWATNEILPRITQLIEKEDYFRAFKLAQQAERYIAEESNVPGSHGRRSPPAFRSSRLRLERACIMKDYRSPGSGWESLGLTPIEKIAKPASGLFRWKIEKEGFMPRRVRTGDLHWMPPPLVSRGPNNQLLNW